MTGTEQINQNRKVSEAWEQLRRSQTWAGGADSPLMMRISRVSHLLTHRLEEMMKLSTSQVRVLFEAMDPEGVSQSKLHKHYHIDPASITRTVQCMERDGLVFRRMDERDNRIMRVFITDKGRALIENLPAQLADFEKELVRDLTGAEVLQLHNLLARLENGLTGHEKPN